MALTYDAVADALRVVVGQRLTVVVGLINDSGLVVPLVTARGRAQGVGLNSDRCELRLAVSGARSSAEALTIVLHAAHFTGGGASARNFDEKAASDMAAPDFDVMAARPDGSSWSLYFKHGDFVTELEIGGA
jgi:hypothetical protein